MPGFLVNPTDDNSWGQHVVLSGRSRRHSIHPIEGTLSIKTMIEGTGTWHTPDGRYEVSPETCLVLNAGQTYGLEIEAPTPAHTFCVFFRPGFVEAVAASLGKRGSVGFYERLNLTPPNLGAQLERLRVLTRERNTSSLEADEAILETAVALVESETAPEEQALLEHAKRAAREEVFRLLNRSRDYALSQIGEKLTLDEMASTACMSPFHYHRLHRQAFGETPHGFVTRGRLSRAMRLLRQGCDVGDVSLALGFESLPTFTRLFKARLGTTPGAFRKIG